jgi:AcrR family transcriptional regulator
MIKNTPRGRPVDPLKQQLQKDKLINAAQILLAEKPYREVTIRNLADHANVNSAMVRYYFGNKEGLFLALLDKMSEKHFIHMKQVSKQQNPIKAFIEFMLKSLTNNNSFARLVHDEFANDNSMLGDAFIEKFPKRMAKFLPVLIKKQFLITDDQIAKRTAFSLISLIIMPFLGRSVRERAWDIHDSELASVEWSDHIYQIFVAGCRYSKN